MLIYSSNINVFSINCVQVNILFELDIFVVSKVFDMSNTLQYKTLYNTEGEINNGQSRETGNIG